MTTQSRILSFLLVFAFWGCAEKKATVLQNKREHKAIQLAEFNTELKTEYVCQIVAHQYVEIRSRMEGYLDKIHVDEGTAVREGQLLFTLQNDQHQADYAKAKANLSNAVAVAQTSELEVEQLRPLVEKNVVSNLELALAKARHKANMAKIEEAQSMLDNAQMLLNFSMVKAPFSGTIDRIPYKRGSVVEDGNLLTRMSDNTFVYAYFKLSEIEYLNYRMAKEQNNNLAEVKLIMANGRKFDQIGKIETMESEFDPTTGTIAFRAKFPNPNRILKHGSTGKIIMTHRLTDKIIIPQKATFNIQDKNYVFAIDDSGMVKQKQFFFEARVGDYYIVRKGLIEGEKIILDGLQEIKNGQEVIYRLSNFEPKIPRFNS